MRPLLNSRTLAGLADSDMREADPDTRLRDAMWEHIRAERFADFESVVRRRIAIADPHDHQHRYHLFDLLGSALNGLARHDEATIALRESLAHAMAIGPNAGEIGPARYALANQALIFGDPNHALAETHPTPEGQGHVQSLLHSVAAQALWKLDRRAEARLAAEASVNAAPTPDTRSDLTARLGHILRAG
jgi:hypothetical protein